MSENTVTLIIQLIGFLVLILGGGKYLGRTESTLTNLTKNQDELRDIIAAHIEKDDERMNEINNKFTAIQINLAKGNRRV